MDKFGKFLFKLRSYTPLPFILILPFIFNRNLITLTIGILLILLGEWIRIISVSFIGSISRTRGNSTGKMIDSGPYRLTRNPLYLGNFFIFLGFVLTSTNWIFIGAGVILFFFQYFFIVKYEETILLKKFGNEYKNYKNSTPAIIPNMSKIKRDDFEVMELKKGKRSEKRTVVAVIFFIIIPIILFSFPIKEFLLGLFK
ncbi:isoprenylcysteine carboxylmethyltransferase family protein [bacterium]|nr:isoprenylcysteine carboxylmethyltransferase family protein [bacterium]